MSYSPAPWTGIKAEKSMRTWWKGAGKLELLLLKTVSGIPRDHHRSVIYFV